MVFRISSNKDKIFFNLSILSVKSRALGKVDHFVDVNEMMFDPLTCAFLHVNLPEPKTKAGEPQNPEVNLPRFGAHPLHFQVAERQGFEPWIRF